MSYGYCFAVISGFAVATFSCSFFEVEFSMVVSNVVLLSVSFNSNFLSDFLKRSYLEEKKN